MPVDLKDLKNIEDNLEKYKDLLPERVSKVIKILTENRGKAYDFIELAELVYNWDRQRGGSLENYLVLFSKPIALNSILEILVKEGKINRVIAKGKTYYFIE